MKRHLGLFVVLALASGALLAAGCGDKSTSLDVAVAPAPAKVGSEQCTNTCHASTVDVTGNPIAATWLANQSAHGGRVGCEDCHGGGANHWGVGPIPYPNPPITQCLACHGDNVGETEFRDTAHANADNFPPPDYFNAPFGDGSDNALLFGAPIYDLDSRGRKVAVSKAQHAQECSVCHNASVRFDIDPRNKALLKPDPENLPGPIVGCSSCHDGHQPDVRIATPTRTRAVAMFNFRNYIVDNVTFAQTPTPSSQTNPGTRLAGTIFMTNGAVQLSGTPDYSRVVGTNNAIYPERLCAACHTKGKYMFAAVNSNGDDISTTHQADVYTQYRLSGHGDRSAAAFGEFSANPPAYDPAFPTGTGSHQSVYPFEMAFENTVTFSGLRGATATTSRNAAVSDGRGGFNDNFPCYKCHHGIGSIAWQDNTEGTSDAPVLFGDVSVTCITCHDPHANVPGQDFNTRKPVYMTKYTAAQSNAAKTRYYIIGNVFLDNQALPAGTGNATICVFCHQGRESGYTLYLNKLAPGDNAVGSFTNPHYLGTGAMLWAHNGYEYAGKQYGANGAHQGANCTTCHMANPTDPAGNGGHTWIPNVASCNTAACHGGAVSPTVDNVGAFPEADGYRATSDTNNYTGTTGGQNLSVAETLKTLQDNVIALLAAQGIFFDDTAYPYFHNVDITVADGTKNNHGSATGFTNWTPATYKAAFNLTFVIKGLPSAGISTTYVVNGGGVRVPDTSQTLVPNASAAVHNYKYTIQLLQDAIADLTGVPFPGARPSTSRGAYVYGPGQ